jgi:hypothetical protein
MTQKAKIEIGKVATTGRAKSKEGFKPLSEIWSWQSPKISAICLQSKMLLYLSSLLHVSSLSTV